MRGPAPHGGSCHARQQQTDGSRRAPGRANRPASNSTFQWRSLLWLGQTWDPDPRLAPSLPPASQCPGASDHPDILCVLGPSGSHSRPRVGQASPCASGAGSPADPQGASAQAISDAHALRRGQTQQGTCARAWPAARSAPHPVKPHLVREDRGSSLLVPRAVGTPEGQP